MRKNSLIFSICVGLIFCFNSNLMAQKSPDELIEDVVSKFSAKEDINTFLNGYAKPMATGLGAGMTIDKSEEPVLSPLLLLAALNLYPAPYL